MSVQLKGMKEVRKKLSNLQKFDKLDMQAVAFEGHKHVMKHFTDQSGPSGKWKAHSKHTKRKGKLLQDSSRLKGSIRPSYSNRIAFVRTNVKYAAIHNYGGKFKAWGKHDAKMPMRKFMWLSKKMKTRIAGMVADASLRAVKLK